MLIGRLMAVSEGDISSRLVSGIQLPRQTN